VERNTHGALKCAATNADDSLTPRKNGNIRLVKILETDRLLLRRLTASDAAFILELLNEPAFLENIGDRGARNLADARRYIAKGPVASYRKFGFGLYLVALKDSGAPIGICGLLKRDALEHVDIGFAFLQKFWSHGYARESAAAVLQYGWTTLRVERIVAITKPHNQASIALLEKLGLRFEKMIQLSDHGGENKLFAVSKPLAGSRSSSQ
jgi:[ribosomal protein S5]-alanine N-acetyltransferase